MQLHPALNADEGQREIGQEFETVLSDLLTEHRAMIDLAQAHRDAISRADARAIKGILDQQAASLDRVHSLERRRQQLVLVLAPEEPRMPMARIAERLAQPWRERTVALAKQLREMVLRVQKEQRVVRTASESLLSHMDGLMQQLAQKLSHAGTYTDRGRADVGRQQVVSGLDLTH